MGALSIRNVRKAYGPTEVLKGINIEVEEGEFLILIAEITALSEPAPF